MHFIVWIVFISSSIWQYNELIIDVLFITFYGDKFMLVFSLLARIWLLVLDVDDLYYLVHSQLSCLIQEKLD